jgi:hypothetical protein
VRGSEKCDHGQPRTISNYLEEAVPSLEVLTGVGTVNASGDLDFKILAELSGGTGEA